MMARSSPTTETPRLEKSARVEKPRIDSLTSLRFFAAAMIVLYHCSGHFGISTRLASIGLGQGVPFFFVLSGFILTYVYPELKGAAATTKFLVARFARIWPAHLASLLAWMIFVAGPDQLQFLPLLANALMVHAWIPLKPFVMSGNIVSWSISTEFGFYFFFPILIQHWKRHWPWILPMLLIGTWGIIAYLNHRHLSALADANAERRITYDAILYFNPICRLFEFALGMSTAVIWRAISYRYNPKQFLGTIFEILALMIAIAGIYASTQFDWIYNTHWPGQPGWRWLAESGVSCVPMAILILIMACQRGQISAILRWPILVLLGEISFSIYLFHSVILGIYWPREKIFNQYPGWLVFPGICVMFLTMSYFVWAVIELPARKFLVGLLKAKPRVQPEKVSPTTGPFLLRPSWKTVTANTLVLAIALGCAAAVVANYSPAWLSQSEAARIIANSQPELRNIRFSDHLVLQGAQITDVGDGLLVTLAWQSPSNQKIDYSGAIQVIDVHGWGIAQFGGPIDERSKTVTAGTNLREEIFVPKEKLAGGVSLGLLLKRDEKILPIDNGPRDYNNGRLVMKLPAGLGN